MYLAQLSPNHHTSSSLINHFFFFSDWTHFIPKSPPISGSPATNPIFRPVLRSSWPVWFPRKFEVKSGDDDVRLENADVEGEREQQEERETEESHRGEDLHRPEKIRQLQATEALRQQRGPQSSLQRSRLDCRRRRHHLQKGKWAKPRTSFCVLFRRSGACAP